MQLETLANELLLDLFTYFHSIDLLQSFFGLNIRFNHLIFHHFQYHSLNLQSISKEHFNDLCHQYLPSLIDQLVSLDLSDNDETPDLPALLLLRSHNFSLNQFIHLKSLLLFSISTFELLYDLICQCQSLAHLTHLKISSKYHDGKKNDDIDREKINDLWNKIWSISKLRRCDVDNIPTADNTSLTLQTTTVSSSIKDLSLKNMSYNLPSLSHLLQCTPRLRHLHHITVYSYAFDDRLTSMSSLLTSMTIIFGGSIPSLIDLFKHLPNLTHLRITTLRIHLDGHIWQDLIENYLCQLKRFEMKMEMDYRVDHRDIEDIVDELLLTYKNSFWCKEHNWYIRCHWNRSDPYKYVTLYTLPNMFDHFDYTNISSTKSTCDHSHNEQYWLYDRVKKVDYKSIETMLLDSFYLFPVQFRYVSVLSIYVPLIDEQIRLHFPSFDHLKSLNVYIYKLSGYDQLQEIFDRSCSSNLHSFRCQILMGNCFSAGLFQLTVVRPIQRIDLLNNRPDGRCYYYSKEECLIIVNSPSSLVVRCEVLLIGVKSRTSIIDLIEQLSNLRVLIVECEDDRYNFIEATSSSSWYWRDELIEWLQEHLPSTYITRRDLHHRSRVQIWIDRKSKSKKLVSDQSIYTPTHTTKLSQFIRSFRQLFSIDTS